MNNPRNENHPLSSEQLERDEWREGETTLRQSDAPGHTVPESERDAAENDEDRPDGGGMPIMPPD